MKTGLVLEGGGLRGIYTAGVLEYLLEQEIYADYVIGVSAGACHGASYASRQKGRAYRTSVSYLKDPRYLSLKNYLTTGSFFGMDFIFHQIPDVLDKFDSETFFRDPSEYWVGVTDAQTGKPVYFGKEKMQDIGQILAASSAIPIFSKPVVYEGREYLDGGTSDPIPYERAKADGCDRLLVVLTQGREYVKKPEGGALSRWMLRDYPEMAKTLCGRAEHYNETRRKLFEKEKQNPNLLVIAPSIQPDIGRFEKNRQKIDALYELGHADAERMGGQIRALFAAQEPQKG